MTLDRSRSPRVTLVSNGTCPECGRPLDDHDRHVRLRLPDPVLAIPEPERADRIWGGDTLLQVQAVGAFVRVLLPIRLTDGHSLTIGTWLAIDPAQLGQVWENWNTDEYRRLVLDGYLANAIEPWGTSLLGAPASARVRDPEELPYLTDSQDPELKRVLTDEWPHDPILRAWEAVT
jgi:hypothetical protein